MNTKGLNTQGLNTQGLNTSGWTSPLVGTLHLYVAFDWGERIDLDRAQTLAPAELDALSRRKRTPVSIAFRPAPLKFEIKSRTWDWPGLGTHDTTAEATVFDFAAVSLEVKLPLNLTAEALLAGAGKLASSEPLIRQAEESLRPLFERLRPAIEQPAWSPLWEEYYVFQFPRKDCLPPLEELLAHHADWLAGLLRLEDGPLSSEEVQESLKMQLRYTPTDLLIPEWAAAVLIDDQCEETLQTIEFANLQLLELRQIDQRLDQSLTEAYRLIHPLTRRWLLFWRTHAVPLRVLGDLKIEANDLLERTNNVLKLVGDQYLARAYRLLAARFHLADWGQSIDRALHVIEEVYQVLSDQAATYRTEMLEWIIILLIVSEIAMTLFGIH